MKSTALIVLFKLAIMDSPTVKTLLNNNNDAIKLKMIIWNNDPDLLTSEDINNFSDECNKKISPLAFIKILEIFHLAKFIIFVYFKMKILISSQY